MNTCTICRHEKRHDIERAIARGVAFRTIANQFNASESSLKRHQQCIAEALLTARKERNYQTARDVDAELEKAFRFVDKVTSA